MFSFGQAIIKKYSPGIILIWAISTLFSCAHSIPDGKTSPIPMTAPPLVDLSRVEFTGEDVYLMPASWDFYWKKFLMPAAFTSAKNPPVPDARFKGMRPWTSSSLDGRTFPGQGFGTYRMLVRLPPGREYAFRFQQQLTAYRAYANGTLKIESGRTGKSRATSRPDRKQNTLYVKAGREPVEIIVHVSNFYMFRGGLKGTLVVGRSQAIDDYANRKIVLDLVLFGFFMAIFLYHISFYFMHGRELYLLVFALFSLGFALRIPFMSEKTIYLVHSGAPFELHLRIMGTLNIVTPGFFIVFLRTLYPDGVSRFAALAYVIPGLAFLTVHFFDFVYLAPVMFIAYGLFLPVLIHAAWITIRMAFRGNVGALLMAAGVCVLAIFGFGAMYLNWRAADASPMALFAFLGSIIFQSLGISRTYRDHLVARDRLRYSLIRSQAALITQRKELETNLHDSLGGALTDLRIIVERGEERLTKTAPGVARELVTTFRERLETMGRMFRGQLLFMEDMELATQNPVIGLHMTLLRRYSDAERELIFKVSPKARPGFVQSMRDDHWRLDMLQLTRELCTNDLKYGKGESRWSISASTKRNELVLVQSNATDTRSGEFGPPERARDRAKRMGGNLEVGIEDEFFSARVVVPLFASP